METLLCGIVGSKAYGTDHPGSDTDLLGVFAFPTRDLLRLEPEPKSTFTTKPDETWHEAGKFITLLLNGNPSATELLWLPNDLYAVVHPLGRELIDLRSSFLGAQEVRNRYFGYAWHQFSRLEIETRRARTSEQKVAKLALHMMRLCHQGFVLYASGKLPVRLANPGEFLKFGEAVAAGDIERAREMIEGYREKFDSVPSVLPREPDRQAAEKWLLKVRDHYYVKES